MTENTLYYGDNLDILRDYIPAESVDLIYLDPPFNSQNVLFRWAQVGYDVHRLDSDGDGVACESLP